MPAANEETYFLPCLLLPEISKCSIPGIFENQMTSEKYSCKLKQYIKGAVFLLYSLLRLLILAKNFTGVLRWKAILSLGNAANLLI
jgi:hypothetical protein